MKMHEHASVQRRKYVEEQVHNIATHLGDMRRINKENVILTQLPK